MSYDETVREVSPIHLTTARIEVLKPEAFFLASKVEGGEWEAHTLGHIDIEVAKLVANNKRRMLLEEGKPFEVRLERMEVVLHEVSMTVQ